MYELITILLVDDDVLFLDLAKDFLEEINANFRVDTVSSPLEALQLLEARQYNVIVSDYQMPEMDGLEFFHKLRETNDVPFILLTGRGREEVVIQAFKLGIDFYLQKGGSPHVLFTELMQYVVTSVEKKRNREKQRRAERRFRELVDLLPQTVIEIAVNGDITFINRSGLETFGYEREEIKKGLNVRYLVIPEERERIELDVHDILRRASIDDNEYIAMRKDGNTLPVLVYSSVIVHEDKPMGLRAIIVDITRHKKIEETLRESEKRFRDVSYSMADWIWEVNKEGIYTYASGKVNQILGYDPNELLGKTPFDLMPETETKRVEEIFRKIASEKRPIVDLENWNLTKSGEKICLLTNAIPLLDEKGELIGYRGVDKDITGRKKVAEELQRRLGVERVLGKVSARFVAYENLNAAIDSTLEDIGELMEVDRVYIFLLHEDKIKMSNTHEWCAPDIQPAIDVLQNLSIEVFPWWMQHLKRRETIHIQDVSSLPVEAQAERKILEMQNIKSLLVFPLYIDSELGGFLGIDDVRNTRKWVEEDIGILRVCTEILGRVLMRKRE